MEYFDDLIGLFLRKHGRDTRVALPEETRTAMRKYQWPGNIRELEKAIQYLLAIKPDGIILTQDLPSSIALSDIEEKNLTLKVMMQAHERFVLVHALSRNKNNITRTALDLKITRMTLQVKMKKLGIKSNNSNNDNQLSAV
jgi:transcriptional regulator of acetoin/glycerol metabolism